MSLAWSSELDQSPITLPTGNYKRAHDKPLPLNTITLNQSMLQHLLQHTTTDAIFSQSFTCRHSRHNSSFSTKLATLCKSGPFRNFRHVAIECTISGDLDPWFWGDKKISVLAFIQWYTNAQNTMLSSCATRWTGWVDVSTVDDALFTLPLSIMLTLSAGLSVWRRVLVPGAFCDIIYSGKFRHLNVLRFPSDVVLL